MNILKHSVGLLIVLALTSCGGGGGNPGSSGGTATTTTATTTPVLTAASFVFSLDKSSINNGGTDKAILTVTALDASRNVVSGVPVSISVDSGIFSGAASSTSATGEVSGQITIGGDKTNRTITASISAGGQTGTAGVTVTGASLAVSTLPATPAPGQLVTVTAKAVDTNGVAISGASIQFGGTLGVTQSVTTNASGNATTTLAAPAIAANYTVTAVGLGVTGTQTVQVVSGTGGGIPNAVGVISIANLSISPKNIFANVAGATTNQATLRAIFQDAANTPIPNVRVRFEIVPPALGSGEQIATGATTVYSDASGIALSGYIPGTRTSPTDGVVVRICYGLDDTSIAGGLCPNLATATLTVGGQAVSVALGFNNTLSRGAGALTYIQSFVAMVTDSNGNPVSNAIVSASVDITHYGKGWGYNDPYYTNGLIDLLITPPDLSTPNINSADIPVAGTVGPPIVLGQRVWCANEDVNRNGFLDAGDDVNKNGKLEPAKANVILSFPGSNKTAADGTLTLQVQYPQNVATWLSFTVTVSTGVAGSAGLTSQSFFTGFIKGDEVNGSFLTPPFGVGNCKSAS
jgi:hypothetical protein